jgi:glycosyltransferase involved in cell wall biosynthesis
MPEGQDAVTPQAMAQRLPGGATGMPHSSRWSLSVPHKALRSLAIVTTELQHLYKNGGIGTCNWNLAGLLAQHGWRVHLLYCGPVPKPKDVAKATRRLAAGCSLSVVDPGGLPPETHVAACNGTWFLELSDRVRHTLEELHRSRHFSLVEFADYQGLGFRPIQAKQAGLAFNDVFMIVKLHSSSQWVREANQSWTSSVTELLLDYCERYAFEHADLQLAPCRYMLDYAHSIGWRVREDAQVIPYVFPEHDKSSRPAPASALDEVVFFGRLETRKGLEVFVEAVRQLPATVKVSFLGKETCLSNGQPAAAFLRAKLNGRPFSLLTDFDRQQALAYLREGNRLAVIPSLVDNCPNTVIECATHGIPFLAARSGGIPELLADPELQADLLFEPDAAALLQRLQHYAWLTAERRRALAEKVQDAIDVSGNHRCVVADYHQMLLDKVLPTVTTPAPPAMRLAEEEPLVTVTVTYYNLPDYLPEALASLAAQTYQNMEVLVIDDGSTDSHALEIFKEQERVYPQFRFLSQPNGGLSAARNFGLAQARGEYFLPMDADNVVRPHMVAHFASALRRNPDISALSCYFLAFCDTADLEAGRFSYAYRPIGGPHVVGSFQNVYGDANAIFRTADLRAVGGYEPDRDSTCEDWEAFVKLVNAGYRLDVVPDHLFYYRHRPASLLRTTSAYRNQRRILRQYCQMADLPKSERIGLWSAVMGMQAAALGQRRSALRYLVADRVNARLRKLPWLHFLCRQVVLKAWISPDRLAG